MNKLKNLILFTTLSMIMFACGSKNQETSEQDTSQVEITNQQFITDSMRMGKIETREFENTVKCSGTIVSLPGGMVKVNAPFRGLVKNIYFQNGQFVEKNVPLVEIAGNEIIDIQNEYAEAAANYKRSKSEYERIKSLYNEKVTSEKDFILAETEYKISLAKYNGFKLKIESIGLSVSKIENGEFYTSYVIKSPINGIISGFKTNIGSYIDTQTELLEIINMDMLQLKLSVFAKDIVDVKKGQSVRFKSTYGKNLYTATINSIGVVIDNEVKSIDCYATFNDKLQTNTIVGEFIEAEIVTKTDTVNALAADAIITDENTTYILILNKQDKDKYLFNKIKVKIGRKYNGYIQINEPKTDDSILIDGTYNISL